jgi:hypothetical protein
VEYHNVQKRKNMRRKEKPAEFNGKKNFVRTLLYDEI